MKITIEKIVFSKKFPVASYLNEDIGFDASIDLTGTIPSQREDEILKGVDYLRDLAELAHKKKYPHLYAGASEGKYIIESQSPTSWVTPVNQPPIINRAAEKTLINIENATTTQQLWDYEEDADKYGLTNVFNAKYRELSR